jgi:hypothetical protein
MPHQRHYIHPTYTHTVEQMRLTRNEIKPACKTHYKKNKSDKQKGNEFFIKISSNISLIHILYILNSKRMAGY